jgi:hypothetical protein
MKNKLLVGLASLLVVGALSAASAFAAPRLWTDSTETTLLRSVTSVPKLQPDALEFINEGPELFQLNTAKEEEPPIVCYEVELGTTVVANDSLVKENLETKLALPFGVAEGDQCSQELPAGPLMVPTYFDTSTTGGVKATITITGGPPFIATIKRLKLSLNKGGTFCTVWIENVTGELVNALEPFVEEAPPNLNVTFAGPTKVACQGAKKTTGFVAARFFLETMSTTTDTAWIGP